MLLKQYRNYFKFKTNNQEGNLVNSLERRLREAEVHETKAKENSNPNLLCESIQSFMAKDTPKTPNPFCSHSCRNKALAKTKSRKHYKSPDCPLKSIVKFQDRAQDKTAGRGGHCFSKKYPFDELLELSAPGNTSTLGIFELDHFSTMASLTELI
jgi:hypothetical protein